MTDKSILALTPDQTPQTRIEVAGSGEVTMATRKQPDWLESVLLRLRDVANLEENWDSYGARQVDQVSVHYAQVFLSHLKEYVGIEKPKITATPNGHVVFIWDDNRRSMEVELDEKGIATYFYESAGDEVDDQTSDYLLLIELLTRI